ncbi:MAG: hypothetical protein ABI643_03555 [Candidatus Doudnabacteria bacterium]
MFKAIAVSILVLAVGWMFWKGPEYLAPPEEAGIRVATSDANKMVKEHAEDVKGQLAKASGYKHADGTVDLTEYRDSRLPRWIDIAHARNIRNEGIATVKGETLPKPLRYIAGYISHWVPTDIAVYSCMKITASGVIWRGEKPSEQEVAKQRAVHSLNFDFPAGPDGEDYSHNPLHKSKGTVIPGIQWGTFIGKVCPEQDKTGESCGAQMPIGSMAYRSPEQIIAGKPVSEGKLWVWTNQFAHFNGSGEVDSDFSTSKGGFTFDAEPAPAYFCDSVTSVASR